MKLIKLMSVLSFLSLIGCASADADLEQAAYILGKGGNPAKAISLASSYLDSSEPLIKYKAVSITAAAKVQQAGFDSTELVANLVHKDDDADFEDVLTPSLASLEDNAKTLLREAEVLLRDVVGSVDGEIQAPSGSTTSADTSFSTVPTRLRANLKFQLGLVRLMEGMRITLVQSGFSAVGEDETFNASDCEDLLDNTEDGEIVADQGARYIENSRLEFETNPVGIENTSDSLVGLIDDFQTQFDSDRNGTVDGDPAEICNALADA